MELQEAAGIKVEPLAIICPNTKCNKQFASTSSLRYHLRHCKFIVADQVNETQRTLQDEVRVLKHTIEKMSVQNETIIKGLVQQVLSN